LVYLLRGVETAAGVAMNEFTSRQEKHEVPQR
jgi:hypothetical protein